MPLSDVLHCRVINRYPEIAQEVNALEQKFNERFMTTTEFEKDYAYYVELLIRSIRQLVVKKLSYDERDKPWGHVGLGNISDYLRGSTFAKPELKKNFRRLDGRSTDLTNIRLFVAKYPNPDEFDGNLWKYYKKFDPTGERQMNLGQFHMQLPNVLRSHFPKMDLPYTDAIIIEQWLLANTSSLIELIDQEKEEISSWDIYKLFDPHGERSLNQAHFYSFLPDSLKQRCTKAALPYKMGQKIDLWISTIEKDIDTIAQETDKSVWELYKRFDPTGTYQLLISEFFAFLPKRVRSKFYKISLPYKACLLLEAWFTKEAKKVEQVRSCGGSTWDLYNVFDPEGKYKMNQGAFHTFIPQHLKKYFEKNDLPYEDYVKVIDWFKNSKAVITPLFQKNTIGKLVEVTNWDLYKLYDPEGKRKMNLGHFASMFPHDLRKKVTIIQMPYEHATSLENWIHLNPEVLHTINKLPSSKNHLWELYNLFDPGGRKKLHLLYFYKFLPEEWRRGLTSIDLPYEETRDIISFLEKSKGLELLRSTEYNDVWEIYKMYDPLGKKMHSLRSFRSVFSETLRKQFDPLDLPYEQCVKMECWLSKNMERVEEMIEETDGNILKIFEAYDPTHQYGEYLSGFYDFLPKHLRDQCKKPTFSFDALKDIHTWVEKNAPKIEKNLEQNKGSIIALYEQYDPSGEKDMRLSDFFGALPNKYKNASSTNLLKYSEHKIVSSWFLSSKKDLAPYLYQRDSESLLHIFKKFCLEVKCTSIPLQGFGSYLNFSTGGTVQQVNLSVEDLEKIVHWYKNNQESIRENYHRHGDNIFRLYRIFDPHSIYNLNLTHFYSALPQSIRNNYTVIHLPSKRAQAIMDWVEKNRDMIESMRLSRQINPKELYRIFEHKDKKYISVKDFSLCLPLEYR